MHETLFPPLKRKKGVNAWPNIPKRAVIDAIKKSENFNAKNVGINDFKISRIPVTIPSFLSNLNKLVAPIFPLPKFLISLPLIFAIIKPKGIEQDKYPNKGNKNFIFSIYLLF